MTVMAEKFENTVTGQLALLRRLAICVPTSPSEPAARV